MNKFTFYTDNTQESTDFVDLCRPRLESDISQVIVLREGVDFNLSEIEADSLPTLRFTFLDGEDVVLDILNRSIEESKSYLKNERLIQS